MKNIHGYEIQVCPIEEVHWQDGGCAITLGEPGWGTFFVSKNELKGVKPITGDAIVIYTYGFSTIRGVVLNGNVIRYETPEDSAKKHEQWKKDIRLERLEEYVAHGDDLKRRAANLPLPLRKRMDRFDAEKGIEFWIESAGYEMAVLEGAAALLHKVEAMTNDSAIKWINDWWDINSDKHDPPYDYKKQMEMVPDFGNDHSGFTASAAKTMAIAVLEGKPV